MISLDILLSETLIVAQEKLFPTKCLETVKQYSAFLKLCLINERKVYILFSMGVVRMRWVGSLFNFRLFSHKRDSLGTGEIWYETRWCKMGSLHTNNNSGTMEEIMSNLFSLRDFPRKNKDMICACEVTGIKTRVVRRLNLTATLRTPWKY